MRTREESIVAQSQLKLALEFLQTKDADFSLLEVVGISNILIDYVTNGYTDDIKAKVQLIDKHLKTKQLTS